MNKGLFGGNRRPRRVPLVYIPFNDFLNIISNEAQTVSTGIKISPPVSLGGVSGEANIPWGFKIVGLQLIVWARSTAEGSVTMTCLDYDASDELGRADSGGHQVIAYSGAVAGHYANASGMVRTGGVNNTQFKYNIAINAGTSVNYVRAIGAWCEPI